MSYQDTQRCYHMLKFGQCKNLHVDPDGKVVHDGLEDEAEYRRQQQKDGIEGDKEDPREGGR